MRVGGIGFIVELRGPTKVGCGKKPCGQSPLPPSSCQRIAPISTILYSRNSGRFFGQFNDWDNEGVAAGRPRNWQEISNADVLVPEHVEFPLGIVHFTGGAGVGTFPRSTYGMLLEALVDAGGCFVKCSQFVEAADTLPFTGVC